MLPNKRLCVFLAFNCIVGCASDVATSNRPREEGAVVTGSRIPQRGGTVQPTGNVKGDDYRDSQRGVNQINKQGS